MYILEPFFFFKSTKQWFPAVLHSRGPTRYVTITDTALLVEKRPKSQATIDRPRVNDKGKTFCKQMKKREKNGRGKQELSGQMFTHESTQLRIIEYSAFWQPSSSRSSRCRSGPAISSWMEPDKREKARGSPSLETGCCQAGGGGVGGGFIYLFLPLENHFWNGASALSSPRRLEGGQPLPDTVWNY